MKISETTLNCCKPNRFNTFKGSESSETSSRKPRYKRYTQMSDDMLTLTSVAKAHNDVQKSGKMRMFKALPQITTSLLGTTIALTQPGKLATKAAAGLGFLALTQVVSHSLDNAINIANATTKNKEDNKLASIALGLGSVALDIACIGLMAKGLKSTKAGKFLQKEAQQLAGEINETKLGKFVENTFNPFVKKHASKLDVASALAPYGIIAASALSQVELADSISEDIKNKASENFKKGKMIQAQARAHFDSIDAEEV